MKWHMPRPQGARSLRICALAFATALVALVTSAGTAAATQPPHPLVFARLGQPDHFGYAVSDLAAVRRQLAAATGSQFTAPRKTLTAAWLPEQNDAKLIEQTVSQTVRGGPVIELVQSTVKTGPWAATADSSTFFYSYAVDSAPLATLQLQQHGFVVTATDIATYAFLRGKSGVTIRVIDKRVAPRASGTNVSQAPVDLGPAAGATVIPCDPVGVKGQLTSALTELDWRPEMRFPLPYEYDDGTRPLLNMSIDASVALPFIVIESPLHAPARYGCTPTAPHVHPMWLTNDVPAAAQQLQNAGMQWVSRVQGLSSLHRGKGGIFIEAASAAFLGG